MDLTEKKLKLLRWILWVLFVILLGIALYYATSRDKGSFGVLPALLGMVLVFIIARLDKAAKNKKGQESKGV